MTTPARPSYAGHRFPAEVISHAVWLYFRFPLSLRHVDEILAARGIDVSHETVRQWGLKFGQAFANQIRRRLPRAGDKWHLDEVAVKIAGVQHWLWRAVDQDGTVLDILVQSRRDKRAAKRLLRKLLKKQCRPPRVLVTDKLASYGVAKKETMPGVEHRQHKGLNNRAENSHQPTRRRERQMKRFNHPARHNASSPPTTRSTTSSTSAAIASPPISIEPQGPRPSRPGPRSLVLPGWHDLQCAQPAPGA
jgi:putative transposase